MKKSGSAVFLMELIIVILFFTLSVTIIFQLFVSAYTTSKESARLNNAIVEAKNAVEKFKQNGTYSLTEWEQITNGGTVQYKKEFINNENDTLSFWLELNLVEENTKTGKFETGTIRAYPVSGYEPILSFDIGVYTPNREVAP